MHVCHCWWWWPLERLHLDAIVFTVCTALKANFVPLHQLQPFHSAFTESVCCFESIIAYFIVLWWIIINHSRSRQKVLWLFHRIHRRQHASTDDAGMSKHRLSPYNAYYHNWLTLKLYSFRFKFRWQVFLESVNSTAFNAAGRQQIPIINNSVRKCVFPNI